MFNRRLSHATALLTGIYASQTHAARGMTNAESRATSRNITYAAVGAGIMSGCYVMNVLCSDKPQTSAAPSVRQAQQATNSGSLTGARRGGRSE
jgi:membrane protease subunit (stomatin/prohibitin family)